jgi:hypothetical protein
VDRIINASPRSARRASVGVSMKTKTATSIRTVQQAITAGQRLTGPLEHYARNKRALMNNARMILNAAMTCTVGTQRRKIGRRTQRSVFQCTACRMELFSDGPRSLQETILPATPYKIMKRMASIARAVLLMP